MNISTISIIINFSCINIGPNMFNTVKNIVKQTSSIFRFQIISKYSIESIEKNVSQRELMPHIVPPVYGQPTALSHPHLVKDGEVVPGLRLEEFKNRRCRLMERIIQDGYVKNPGKPQVVIIPSSSVVYMSDKIPYVFRQNTDFLYFSGCQEPDSVLVITTRDENFTSTLFVRKKDEHSELWDGPRTGVEAAKAMFGVDQALPVTEFEQFIVSFMNEHKKSIIWYNNANVVQSEVHMKLVQLVKMTDNQTFASPETIFHQTRLFKSPAEIDLMKKSCDIASAAIAKTIEISKPNMCEHELYATVDYECRMRGAEFLAYPPVIAGGRNANIIHYIKNNQLVQNGDMVLMDAGCEYHGYSSDITRTWPINGKFSNEQRMLYEIVLDVQSMLIQKVKEMPSLDQLFSTMCLLLGQRLQEIGLIPKQFTGDKLLAAAYTYCPHHVSHYLGMDVHDTGKISRSIKVQPGMIVTVEPGIYVNPKNQFAPPDFYGLGIRIEDDVLVTSSDPIILTNSCPKEISDIEKLASQNQC